MSATVAAGLLRESGIPSRVAESTWQRVNVGGSGRAFSLLVAEREAARARALLNEDRDEPATETPDPLGRRGPVSASVVLAGIVVAVTLFGFAWMLTALR